MRQSRRTRGELFRLAWVGGCSTLLSVSAGCAGTSAAPAAGPGIAPPSASCPLVAANANAPSPSASTTPTSMTPTSVTPTSVTPTSAETKLTGPSYPPLQLGGTQVRDLKSALTGKQHRFLIALPPSFESEPTRRYPVLYVLDGQWDFPLVASLSGGLRFDQVLPEMLIVGLSWAGQSPDYDALRSDDYLPTRAKNRNDVEVGGGGPHFLSFLANDVIPLMEREYRADPDHRVLAGTSNGGLFTLYALFERPELFWGYIAISPNVGWDDKALMRQEQAFHAAHPALDRRVWLSSGSAEWPDYLSRESAFFKQFTASRYRGVALHVYQVNGERHAGVKPEAYNRALRFIAEPLVTPKQ